MLRNDFFILFFLLIFSSNGYSQNRVEILNNDFLNSKTKTKYQIVQECVFGDYDEFRFETSLLKIDENSVMGFITTLANCIPMFSFAGDMNKKGRIMNYAFATSAAFVFGDQLVFILAFSADQKLSAKYLIAVIVGKLVGGISSLVVAQLLYKKLSKEEVETENEEKEVLV